MMDNQESQPNLDFTKSGSVQKLDYIGDLPDLPDIRQDRQRNLHIASNHSLSPFKYDGGDSK